MKILQHKEAPKALVELIRSEYQDLPIENVILCGGTDQLFGRMSVFEPETKSVVIDMKACMEDRRWMEKGLTYIANMWVNLIYCVMHEGAHAVQLVAGDIDFDPERWDAQHKILDEDADRDAIEWVVEWLAKNPGVPPLNKLGWVGQQVQALFNGLYHKAQDFIDEEVLLWGAGMPLERAALSPNLRLDNGSLLKDAPPEYQSMSASVRLIEEVNANGKGINKDGRMCLTIDAALELVARS